VYSPRIPKFSKTWTLGQPAAYPRCGHYFGVADGSSFVLVGDPARIHLIS
jgi:hypothetical protein